MVAIYGSSPADILAGIGPAIGPCCYEVGQDLIWEVSDAFGESDNLFRLVSKEGQDQTHFDQWAANEHALRQAGVQMIERADLCTACHVDEFYSHRAERGRTGRFGAIIGLQVPGSGLMKHDNSK